MSSSPPPPVPPPQQIGNTHNRFFTQPHKPTTTILPDLFLTALSLLLFFSPAAPTTTTTTNKHSRIPFLSFQFNPRRSLKIPTMSLPAPNPKSRRNLNLHHLGTPQFLSDWLKSRLPSESFASWGVKPGTKNVHNLWLELSEGETSLADTTPPVRTVQVVSVRIIGNDNRVLIESRQELSDGTIRFRNRPLSEKMKPDETPESAVSRAVKEELSSIIHFDGSEVETVRIVPGSYKTKIEERNSVSYPGLPACYILHLVDAWVRGLPDGEFCTEEDDEYPNCKEATAADKVVSVKRHFWKWVSADSVES